MVKRLVRFSLCLALLVGSASCDYLTVFVGRSVPVPSGTVACVQDALRSDPSWTSSERRRRKAETTGVPTEGSLVLPTEDGYIVVRAELEDAPPLLRLRCDLSDDPIQRPWEDAKTAYDEHLRSVYERLRHECPELWPWRYTAEEFRAPASTRPASLAVMAAGLIAFAGLGVGLSYLVIQLARPRKSPAPQEQPLRRQ